MNRYHIIFTNGDEVFSIDADTPEQAMRRAEGQMARNYGESLQAERAVQIN